MEVYAVKEEAAVRGEIARTRFKLALVLRDAGQKEESVKERVAAEGLRHKIVGQENRTDGTEEDYDRLIAYFYR